ncbi:AtpZ/AtpI family protein [Salinarimonas chemoclinalis]|uniref:AtpZ/AtpI family protein n=1 Tax=Salinarimonas chemoclinalis TaxID=3241599 RepID=UPI003556C021
MVRPASGGSTFLRLGLRTGTIMGDPTGRNDEGGEGSGTGDEADLSARLRRLDTRLGDVRSRRDRDVRAGSRAASDMSGLGKALRFSAEFIAGVIAGAGVGWALDQVAGTSPWGMIVGLVLGFCAGMLNIMRAAGELNRKPRSGRSPGDGGGGPGDGAR